MKKEYTMPATVVVATVMTEMLLAGSGVQSAGGIGYGGVDSEGSKDPSARQRRDVWDDDWQDDVSE